MVKGYVCQADILKIDEELQKTGLYGKEKSEVARFCLSCLLVGAKKRTVEMLSQPIAKENFAEYWKNMQSNHYFTPNKKIDIESTDTTPFLLMVNCAQGKIQRVESKKESEKMNVFERRPCYTIAGWRWLLSAVIQHHNLMELAELTHIILKEP